MDPDINLINETRNNLLNTINSKFITFIIPVRNDTQLIQASLEDQLVGFKNNFEIEECFTHTLNSTILSANINQLCHILAIHRVKTLGDIS